MNDQQIEQEIQAKGLTAPRVTPDNGASPMQGIETPETADNLPQGVEQ